MNNTILTIINKIIVKQTGCSNEQLLSIITNFNYRDTWVLFLTDCVKTDNGPVLNSSSSLLANSSGVISDLGLVTALKNI